ncbi:MAG: phosphoribosyl-ATP diphosphatase [Caldilineaceae bacterium]|nr:phosphoribosyl-ATP diphosphatase [Caldilineaceae bacterium]
MTAMQALFETIQDRKLDPPVGSYTATLFEKGENEILKKIGEEAVEVIIAAGSEGDDRVLYEMADMFYHSLVLLASRGLTLADLENELSSRFK